MRRLVSFIALSALLAAQTPFTPCSAAMTDDERAPRAALAAAESAQHHHHAVAEAAVRGAADVNATVPPEHGPSCTMLTRCEWVAVPTEPIGSEPLRGFTFTSAGGIRGAPAAAERLAPTPPPRSVS